MNLASADFGSSFVLELVALVFIALFIVRKVVPPLRKAMNRKLESITAQLAAGEEARKVAATLVAARAADLERARTEAETLVAQAKESAAQLVEDGRRRADAEFARLSAHAEVEIGLELAKVRDEVLGRVGALVASAVGEVVGAELNESSHRRLIDGAIAAAEAETAV